MFSGTCVGLIKHPCERSHKSRCSSSGVCLCRCVPVVIVSLPALMDGCSVMKYESSNDAGGISHFYPTLALTVWFFFFWLLLLLFGSGT